MAGKADDRAPWQRQLEALIGDDHGARVKLARKIKPKMRSSQLGDLINVPGQNPQIRQLQRIADALGVPLAISFGTSSPEQAHHGRTQVPDPFSSARIKAAVRDALAEFVAGMAVAFAPAENPRAHESPAGSHSEETSGGAVAPDDRGAVRRSGAE